MDEVRKQVDGGHARAGFVIPADYSRDIQSGRTAQVQLSDDGTDPTTAQTILPSAGGVFHARSVEIIEATMGKCHAAAAGAAQPGLV